MNASRLLTPRHIAIAACLLIVVALLSGGVSGWPLWTILVCTIAIAASVISGSPAEKQVDQLLDESRAVLRKQEEELRKREDLFEDLKSRSTALLQDQSERLQERERSLASRLTQFHEILEYPQAESRPEQNQGELVRLSEADREVNRILEAEAERVYEKIRANGYLIDGRVDVAVIRDELLQLVQRIARIYSPGSQNPLLETSFEQLARAASRICLHSLVLLEQLPVSVQHYSINSLYRYLQTAVQGYGTYKKAAPWLTYLSRGMYVGRVLSTTNPLALGAWWLATEVGKKGAQRWVENLVDRQAVAVLHDLVTVVGVEFAGIYGPGFRHRDPAWVLGTELVELISQFPLSRESLREGLRQITALPMRNEYDRIYLYRCLASHRAGGLRLQDSAMLSRAEREIIAARLEEFFSSHIHGAVPAQVAKWRESFEERFDLRLNLSAERTSASQLEQACSGMVSLAAFLISVAGVSPDEARDSVAQGRLPGLLTAQERQEFLPQLTDMVRDRRFEPPNLEPSSSVTEAFLHDMASCVVRLSSVRMLSADEHLESLVIETGAYFRHSIAEMQSLVDSQWIRAVRELTEDGSTHSDLNARTAREILTQRTAAERVEFCFPDVHVRLENEQTENLPGAWLVGLRDTASHDRRAVLLRPGAEHRAVWQGEAPLQLTRERGLLVDSISIQGGQWTVPLSSTPPIAIIISGSLRGGRYRNYFRSLLRFGD